MIFRNSKKLCRDVSVIGLGCWGLSGASVWEDCDDSESIATVHSALELGINFFDVAPVYGFGHAEEILGRALKESNIQRTEYIIASKCGLEWDDSGNITNNLSKNKVLDEIDRSLERLGVEYLDIYQLHWPDKNVRIEETLEAVIKIQESGKIKHVGLTNFSIADTLTMMEGVELVSLQGLYNMLERNPVSYHTIPLEYKSEDELLPFCKEHDLAFLPYSPLMQGLLSGAFNSRHNFSEKDVRASNPRLVGENYKKYYKASVELKDLAAAHGHPLNELAFNWLVSNQVVTSVIAGGNKPWQVEANVKSLDWQIDSDLLAKIEVIVDPFKNDL